MLDQLSCECSARNCDQSLTEERRMLTMTTPRGTRCAYECSCGAVTVTVVREYDGARDE